MINAYLSDGVTSLDGYVFPDKPEAGELSDPVVIHYRNDDAETAPNVMLVQRTQNPLDPSRKLATGVPPQDQLWGRMRITGFLNPTDPTWAAPNTDWFAVGAYSGLPVGDVPAGCTVITEYAIQPPGDAQELGWVTFPIAMYAERSLPLPPALSSIDRGVLHGIGEPSRSGLVMIRYTDNLADPGDYGTPLPSGTPDDNVYLGPVIHLQRGRLYPMVGETFTFDQLDAASAALAAGQSYWVTFSAAGGVRTATKGAKATSPTKAAVPAGDDLLGHIQIHYGAGGTVIDSPDLDWYALPERLEPLPHTGLILAIMPGWSAAGGTLRFCFAKQLLPLDDDTTSYVWQLASGLCTATTTDEYPDTASMPICEVDTASGVITAIRDRRIYAGHTEVLTLRGAPPSSIGTIQRYVVAHEGLVIDRTLTWASDNGTGSGGQLQLDWLLNGTTMFPSFAAEDWRPFFAFDAPDADLTVHWALPEVVNLKRGDVLELVSIENPTGGDPPEEVIAQLVCRKP